MTRQFKLLAMATVLFVLGTGQTPSTGIGCLDDCIADEIAGVFDGDGCLAGLVGDCGGGCGDCMGECGACDACGDGCGCDGCSLEKIPGTFGDRPRVPNIAQVRLTSSGFAFLESMVAPMLGDVIAPMAKSLVSGDERDIEVLIGALGTGAEKQICASSRVDSCGAEIDVRDVKVIMEPQAAGNDRLRLRLSLAVLLVSHKGNTRHVGWLSRERTCGIGICGSWSNCTISYDTNRGSQQTIDVDLVFELGTSGVNPRADVNIISLRPMGGGAANGSIKGIEVAGEVQGCGLDDLVNNDIAEFVVYRVTQELNGRLPQFVRTMLCEDPANLVGLNGQPGVCPSPTTLRTYSFGMDGILEPVQRCGESNAACLPILLGMEGRLDLGGLLGSLIPGYSSVIDFFMALADGAETPNNGLSMWMKAGIDTVGGHSDCVPLLPEEEVPAIPTVAKARVFHGNVHPGTAREPDVMIGVSEQFVNWAAYKLWDAGALCIQVGSTTIPMLSPSLLGIALGTSLNTLVFPADSKKSPLGLALRPQKPPVVRFEELASPGLRVNAQLPQLAIDFYAWSLDRYVRLVTIELDVTASVDVKVNDGKVGIYLGGIAFENAEAKNASLVSNPASIVNFFGAGIGGIISSVLGSSDAPLFELDLGTIIPSELEIAGNAIPLPMGVELREDAFAVVFVDAAGNTVSSREVGADTFMGIFVDFTSGGAPASGLEGAIQTHVEVTSVYIPEDRTAFQPETLGQGELPRVEIYMSADAPEGVPLEYRYRLALGGWSEWQDSPYAVIESPALALQQEHLIMARARVKGDPRSEDKSSAIAKARIDVTPPLIDLADDGKKVRLQAVDFVSPMSNLQYRYREPGGEFSEWQSFGDASVALLDASQEVEVEVRDEAGNIASNVAELRGLPQAEPGGGCSCTVAGKPTNSGSTLGFLAMLAVLGGTFYRVRRRRSA